MSNEYYTHGIYPKSFDTITSAAMAGELELVEQGFDKLAPLTGNAEEVMMINSGGTAILSSANLQFQAAGPELILDGTLAGTGLTITSPTISGATISGATLTTPTFTTSTFNSPTFTTPTITTPGITGNLTINGVLDLNDTTTVLRLTGTGGGADENVVQLEQNAGDFHLSLVNDAGSVTAPVMTVTRSGMTITEIDFPTGNLQVDGVTIVPGDTSVLEEIQATFTTATNYVFAHGLGAIPSEFWAVFYNPGIWLGYPAGSEASFVIFTGANDPYMAPAIWADATNITIALPHIPLVRSRHTSGGPEQSPGSVNHDLILRYRK